MLIDPKTFKTNKPLRFIVLEGVNGAGKSTLQSSLAKLITQSGREVVTTREPGATELGQKLRQLILSGAKGDVTALSEMFLFGADRADHVAKVIRPALERDAVVISDRYFYSSIAFQGHGRGMDQSVISKINELAVQGVLPGLVILLDLDPATGLKRNSSAKGNDERDTFEEKDLAFHQRIRQGFIELSTQSAEPFLMVDATKSQQEIFSVITPLIERNL